MVQALPLKGSCSSKCLTFVLATLFFSCASVNRNQSVAYYQAHPLSLFEFAVHRLQFLKSLEGSAFLQVESPQGGFQGNARVYYQKPDSLLVQIKTGPGVSVGHLLIIGQDFWLYNIPDNILFTSHGRQVPLEELIGIRLYLPNIMDAALGIPGTHHKSVADSSAGHIRHDFVNGKIRYQLKSENKTYIYLADPVEEAIIAYSLIDEAEADTIYYQFKQFQRHQGINIPRHIQITRPSNRERISFFYQRVKVNDKLPGDRFELKVSDSAERIELSQIN